MHLYKNNLYFFYLDALIWSYFINIIILNISPMVTCFLQGNPEKNQWYFLFYNSDFWFVKINRITPFFRDLKYVYYIIMELHF